MRQQSRRFRLCAAVAAGSLVLAPLWTDAAWAQSAPQPLAGGTAAAALDQAPPTRAGRLAQITGTVSFHAAEDTQWSPAVLNYPVTAGDSFWTEPQAQASVELGGNRFLMMSSTELDVTQLDDHAFAATVPQGEVCMALPYVPGGDTYAIQTPRGLVQIAATGNVAIVAGDTQNPTTVLVQSGAAQITGTGLALQVGPGQMASISGSDQFQGSVGPAPGADTCLQQLLTPPPPQLQPAAQTVAPPPVVQEMTGYQDLQQYGSWQQTSNYGAVWYPQVASDWVPYREGRWAYVAPWGWTWVDSDPWGFAPFHYGRWIEQDNRWGWAPSDPGVAYGEPPVYAPALVNFFGVGAALVAGAAVGAALGYAFSGGNVGWAPLGWHEPYYPWYRANNAYVARVNRYNVTNVNQVVSNYRNTTYVRNVTVNNYANFRRGATVVPAQAMIGSRPVRAAAISVPPAELARATPAVARQPLRPAIQTIGVNRPVAQQLRLPPAASGAPARPVAPGPRQATATPRPGVRPPLRPASAAPPLLTGRPGVTVPRPGLPVAARPGAPPLRTPAEVRRGIPPVPQPLTATARPGVPQRQAAPGAGVPARPGTPPLRTPAQLQHGGPPALHPQAAPQRLAAPAAIHPPAPVPVRPVTPQAAVHPGARPALRPPAPPQPAAGAAVPRAAPVQAPHPAPASHPSAAPPHVYAPPHPVAAPRPAPAPQRPQPQARPAAVARPAPVFVPRPAPAPRPMPVARPAPPPHPVAVPRPAPMPHPAPAARPEPPRKP